MKKILIILVFISYSISTLFAVATVSDFFGKVKVKFQGDTTWSKIYIGMEIPNNATVSTGFNSQIVLDLGNATLDVMPLTRMTVNEITESQDTINTSLFLQGGKIKADVKKIEGKVNDFSIKSPVATASVRGTAFAFSGNKLEVFRGEVAFRASKKSEKKPTIAQEKTEEADTLDSEAPSSGVAVRAGGLTEMSSSSTTPVKPSAMAQKSRSTSATTKPAVVKTATNLSVVPTPSVVQSVIVGTARITIKAKIVE